LRKAGSLAAALGAWTAEKSAEYRRCASANIVKRLDWVVFLPNGSASAIFKLNQSLARILRALLAIFLIVQQ